MAARGRCTLLPGPVDGPLPSITSCTYTVARACWPVMPWSAARKTGRLSKDASGGTRAASCGVASKAALETHEATLRRMKNHVEMPQGQEVKAAVALAAAGRPHRPPRTQTRPVQAVLIIQIPRDQDCRGAGRPQILPYTQLLSDISTVPSRASYSNNAAGVGQRPVLSVSSILQGVPGPVTELELAIWQEAS